jgi:hypothetical protein
MRDGLQINRKFNDLEHDRKFKIMLARRVAAVANFQSSKMALMVALNSGTAA